MKTTITIRIPEKLKAKLDHEAVITERTRTDIILTLLREYLYCLKK